MDNSISNNPNALAQLLGNGKADPKGNPNDLTGLMRAQQEASQKAQGLQSKFAPQDEFMPSSKGMQAAAAMESFQDAYAYSQTMSMELTTREGDTVKVDFRQLYAQYQEYKSEQKQEEGPKGVRQFESRDAMEMNAFEEKFAFSVEGDLNEAELKAVFDVFEQVDGLANEFYNGNIEEAFQKAVDMNVDMGQLQSFSLDLQRTETRATSYQQAAAYQGVQQQPTADVAAENVETPEEKGVSVSDLPPYLQKWQEAIGNMEEQFESARAAFDQIMSGVLSQRFPEQDSQPGWYERVQAFHDKLAEAAGLDKNTLVPSTAEDTADKALEANATEAEQAVPELATEAKESVLTDKK